MRFQLIVKLKDAPCMYVEITIDYYNVLIIRIDGQTQRWYKMSQLMFRNLKNLKSYLHIGWDTYGKYTSIKNYDKSLDQCRIKLWIK